MKGALENITRDDARQGIGTAQTELNIAILHHSTDGKECDDCVHSAVKIGVDCSQLTVYLY